MLHVILCGGSGSRLWPLSREQTPKQFLPLIEEKTLFQTTLLGNKSLCNDSMVVSSADHYYLAQNQLQKISLSPRAFILEPLAKNTAAACCLSALCAKPEEILLITPADHFINYNEEYDKAVLTAKNLAEQNYITIFGVKPTYPETGYGYIESENGNVVKFHEKPNRQTVEEYCSKGKYYWNSGMICCRAKILLKMFELYAPSILETSKKALELSNKKMESGSEVIRIQFEDMSRIPSDSIDYAILEKMQPLKMIEGFFSWSDLGSFDSLYAQLPKDSHGNACDGNAYHPVSSSNNLVISDRLVSTIDVDNLLIIDTKDALLISKNGSSQKVKEVVNQLKNLGTYHHRTHLDEKRPWGSFTVLESSETFKVKKIAVHPGKKLSLQKHAHRNEHWVIVTGKALVTLNENQFLLESNQSIYIPSEAVHRVENIGEADLIFIEVQYGDYTGEDDIIRIEDDFVRSLNY